MSNSYCVITGPPTTSTLVTPTTYFSKFYSFLRNTYSVYDSYFYYRDQRIFVSKIKPEFLDYAENWNALGCNVLVIYNLSKLSNLSGQQFFYKSKNYPGIDLYYLPFNFYTTNLVYSDNSALVRSANNLYFRIFSIGSKVVSLINEDIEPNVFSNPTPATISVGSIEYVKDTPNGTPIVSASFVDIVKPQVFDQLIIYPLGPLADVIVTGFSDALYYTEVVEEATVNANLKYFLLETNRIKQTSVAEPVSLDNTLSTFYDTIYTAIKPVIGNNNLYLDKRPTATIPTNRDYQAVTIPDLSPGDIDTNGNVVPDPNKFYFRVTRTSAQPTNQSFYVYAQNICNPLCQPTSVAALNYGTQLYDYDAFSTFFLGTNSYPNDFFYIWNRNQLSQWPIGGFFDAVPADSKSYLINRYNAQSTEFKGEDINYNIAVSNVANSSFLPDDKLPTSEYGSNYLYTNNFDLVARQNFDRIHYISSGSNLNFNSGTSGTGQGFSVNTQQDAFSLSLNQSGGAIGDKFPIDGTPFQFGARFFPTSIDYPMYFSFKNIIKNMIRIPWNSSLSLDPVNFENLGLCFPLRKNDDSTYTFDLGQITAQFTKFAIAIQPYFNTLGGSTNTNLGGYLNYSVYSTLGRRFRGSLIPSFISNEREQYSIWNEIVNLRNFQIIFKLSNIGDISAGALSFNTDMFISGSISGSIFIFLA